MKQIIRDWIGGFDRTDREWTSYHGLLSRNGFGIVAYTYRDDMNQVQIIASSAAKKYFTKLGSRDIFIVGPETLSKLVNVLVEPRLHNMSSYQRIQINNELKSLNMPPRFRLASNFCVKGRRMVGDWDKIEYIIDRAPKYRYYVFIPEDQVEQASNIRMTHLGTFRYMSRAILGYAVNDENDIILIDLLWDDNEAIVIDFRNCR